MLRSFWRCFYDGARSLAYQSVSIDSVKSPLFTHGSSASQTDGRIDGQTNRETDGKASSTTERLLYETCSIKPDRSVEPF